MHYYHIAKRIRRKHLH